ncbi:hypothetical protein C8R45DRAFT_974901, partial [Mycena sanguinolenta]
IGPYNSSTHFSPRQQIHRCTAVHADGAWRLRFYLSYPCSEGPRVHLEAEATREFEVLVAHGRGRPDSAPPPETPLPVLHAVSASGTKLSFYNHTKGRKDPILPAGIPYDRIRANDVAPREWWVLDVLEDGGEQRLRMVIDNYQNVLRTSMRAIRGSFYTICR